MSKFIIIYFSAFFWTLNKLLLHTRNLFNSFGDDDDMMVIVIAMVIAIAVGIGIVMMVVW